MESLNFFFMIRRWIAFNHVSKSPAPIRVRLVREDRKFYLNSEVERQLKIYVTRMVFVTVRSENFPSQSIEIAHERFPIAISLIFPAASLSTPRGFKAKEKCVNN